MKALEISHIGKVEQIRKELAHRMGEGMVPQELHQGV
jgi:hypothetical protein